MEKHRVQVVIRGTQQDVSEESIQQIYQGVYSFRNGSHYIRYEESYQEEGESQSKGLSLLKIKEDTILMSKKGAITTKMQFDPGKITYTPYQTPYGTFQMEVITTDLTIRRKDKDFLISIHYQLNMDNQPLSQCSIEIEVKF